MDMKNPRLHSENSCHVKYRLLYNAQCSTVLTWPQKDDPLAVAMTWSPPFWSVLGGDQDRALPLHRGNLVGQHLHLLLQSAHALLQKAVLRPGRAPECGNWRMNIRYIQWHSKIRAGDSAEKSLSFSSKNMVLRQCICVWLLIGYVWLVYLYVSICLFVCLFVCLLACLFVCSFVRSFVCLFTVFDDVFNYGYFLHPNDCPCQNCSLGCLRYSEKDSIPSALYSWL